MMQKNSRRRDAADRGRQSADVVWSQIDWTQWGHNHAVRGRRVHYVDIGTGPAVLLVHGQGGSWQFWLRVIPALAEHCRVIAVDLPGFGGSDVVAQGDVIDEQLHTLTALVRHLGLARVVVVGHSMGGLVTMRLTAEFPGVVAGLVLVDAGGSPIGARRLSLILQAFRVFNAVFGIPRIARFVAHHKLLYSAVFAPAVADHRAMSPVLAMQILPRMAAPGFIATMRAAAGALTEMHPEDTRRPALVIWGDRDRILPVAGGRALAARIPGARFEVLNLVGHCPMIESPTEFSDLVTEFAVTTIRATGPESSQADLTGRLAADDH